jgi:ribosomal protein L32
MADSEQVYCPNCGAAIRRSARACPECGADEETGWSERTYLDGIDIPDEGAYEETLESEFGSPSSPTKAGAWRIYVAVALLLVFLLFILRAAC